MNEIICSKCGKTLDATGIEPFTQCECSECGAALVVPKKAGTFILQNHLGRMSHFDVYEAFDMAKNMPETVYIMDNTIPGYDELLKIARDEAAHLATLKQANISPVISSGEIEGAFFAAEPMMDGYPMSSYDPATQPPLAIDNVIEIMKAVGMGLATAHHRDMPHHGICPENIHMDARGNVRLKNFFVSRYIYRLEEQQNSLERHSEASPYFISPERAENGEEDKRGDVFSYGALFYFLLTGKYPFDGKSELEIVYSRIKKIRMPREGGEVYNESAGAAPLTKDAVAYVPPHPLSKLRPEIDERLGTMIVKALSSYPASRPTVTHILDFITSYQAELDKERNFTSVQKKIILAKTIAALPPKKGGLSALFKF